MGVCSIGLYETVSHAHRVTIHREIESIAHTFHKNLKIHFKKSENLEDTINHVFQSFCIEHSDCLLAKQKILTSLNESVSSNYYIEIIDLSKNSLAVTETKPSKLRLQSQQDPWKYFKDPQNNRYHQISIELQTVNGQPWGYLIVGRNLKDFDHYVASIAWVLILGFPIALILVSIAAWYLSNLAIKPIYYSYQKIQRFTGDAAHELRTPIATIRATIESVLMQPEWQQEEIQNLLISIERQNYRMSSLVNDLLTLSRIDGSLNSKANHAVNQAIILNDLVDDIAEEFAALALAKKINLEIKKDISQLLVIDGDESQIYRLLANLIMNALQYTPENGDVTLILSVHNRQAVIEVTDTGIGISQTEQIKIFERFYRVNHDRSRHTGGSGLGLAIADAIAKLYGGSIEVNSKLSHGSKFTIRLPCKQQ